MEYCQNSNKTKFWCATMTFKKIWHLWHEILLFVKMKIMHQNHVKDQSSSISDYQCVQIHTRLIFTSTFSTSIIRLYRDCYRFHWPHMSFDLDEDWREQLEILLSILFDQIEREAKYCLVLTKHVHTVLQINKVQQTWLLASTWHGQ